MHKKILSLSVLLVLFFTACQKEMSVETSKPARGSLKSSSTGDCLPKTVKGIFLQDSALKDSNFIQVELNVAEKGSYNIKTDTVNGYFFSGKGNFNSTGTNTVILKGSGKPVNAGTDIFAVYFDTTFCTVAVDVLPANAGGPAVYTLRGAGGACTNAVPSGNFVKGTALTASSKVDIGVNVTTIGTYNITTNTVNGFSFTGTGAFTTTGLQTVTLTPTGTPLNEGSSAFILNAGTGTCGFTVTVTATGTVTPLPIPTGDLFPLTANSWWSYVEDEGELNDTLTVSNISSRTFAGQTYRAFVHNDTSPPDSFYYRKSGNDYFEYADVNTYSLIDFDVSRRDDILFLKENAVKGNTWNSKEYLGKVSGIDTKLRYAFTCVDANVTKTVNGKTYQGVTEIRGKAQVAFVMAGTTSPYTDETTSFTMYYAKGIGMIYQNFASGSNIVDELFLKSYKVN